MRPNYCTRKRKGPVLREHEEEEIVHYIIEKAKKNEPVNRQEVIKMVFKFLASDNRKNPFKSGNPGNKWFSLFRRRHNSNFLNLEPEQLRILEEIGFSEKVKSIERMKVANRVKRCVPKEPNPLLQEHSYWSPSTSKRKRKPTEFKEYLTSRTLKLNIRKKGWSRRASASQKAAKVTESSYVDTNDDDESQGSQSIVTNYVDYNDHKWGSAEGNTRHIPVKQKYKTSIPQGSLKTRQEASVTDEAEKHLESQRTYVSLDIVKEEPAETMEDENVINTYSEELNVNRFVKCSDSILKKKCSVSASAISDSIISENSLPSNDQFCEEIGGNLRYTHSRNKPITPEIRKIICGSDNDLSSLRNVVYKLEQISDKIASAATADDYDHFGKYLATMLRGIPHRKFLSLKQKFIDDVIEAKMALDESNNFCPLISNCTSSTPPDPLACENEVDFNACQDDQDQSVPPQRQSDILGPPPLKYVNIIENASTTGPSELLPSIPIRSYPTAKGDEIIMGNGNSNTSLNRKRPLEVVFVKRNTKKPHCEISQRQLQLNENITEGSFGMDFVYNEMPTQVQENIDTSEQNGNGECLQSNTRQHISMEGLPTSDGNDALTGYKVIARHLAEIEESLCQLEENQQIILNFIRRDEQVNQNQIDLPCQSVDDIQKLEDWLNSDQENQENLEMVMAQKGGKSLKQATARILESIFKNKVAVKCNWTGKNGKIPLKHLKIIQVVERSVRRSPLAAQATNVDIINCLSNWFRFAKSRDGGSDRRRHRSECSEQLKMQLSQ